MSTSFQVEETIASDGGPENDGIGQWHKIKDIAKFTGNMTTYSIIPSATGTGKIQYTLESGSEMDDGTAIGIDWIHGLVTGGNLETNSHHLAGFRIVCTSGTIKMNAESC